MERSAKKRAVVWGWEVAIRSPFRSSIDLMGDALGTAAASRQNPKPSLASASRAESGSDSSMRSSPVIPTSATPSISIPGMSSVRTSTRSTSTFMTRSESARSVTSKAIPALFKSRREGSRNRPLLGTARVREALFTRNLPIRSRIGCGRAPDDSRPFHAAATG